MKHPCNHDSSQADPGDLVVKEARCRSTRTVCSPDGRKAKIRCGLDRGHETSHSKFVTFPDSGHSTIARWQEGTEAVFDKPPPFIPAPPRDYDDDHDEDYGDHDDE